MRWILRAVAFLFAVAGLAKLASMFRKNRGLEFSKEARARMTATDAKHEAEDAEEVAESEIVHQAIDVRTRQAIDAATVTDEDLADARARLKAAQDARRKRETE